MSGIAELSTAMAAILITKSARARVVTTMKSVLPRLVSRATATANQCYYRGRIIIPPTTHTHTHRAQLSENRASRWNDSPRTGVASIGFPNNRFRGHRLTVDHSGADNRYACATYGDLRLTSGVGVLIISILLAAFWLRRRCLSTRARWSVKYSYIMQMFSVFKFAWLGSLLPKYN